MKRDDADIAVIRKTMGVTFSDKNQGNLAQHSKESMERNFPHRQRDYQLVKCCRYREDDDR